MIPKKCIKIFVSQSLYRINWLNYMLVILQANMAFLPIDVVMGFETMSRQMTSFSQRLQHILNLMGPDRAANNPDTATFHQLVEAVRRDAAAVPSFLMESVAAVTRLSNRLETLQHRDPEAWKAARHNLIKEVIEMRSITERLLANNANLEASLKQRLAEAPVIVEAMQRLVVSMKETMRQLNTEAGMMLVEHEMATLGSVADFYRQSFP
jgi:hypothetical protein